jgi:hypothetical protein
MIPPEEGLGFWQWVAGGIVSVFSGLIGGAWISRGVLEKIKQTNDNHEHRICIIERNCADNCKVLAQISTNLAVVLALQSEMKADVKEVFDRLNRRADDRRIDEDRRI